MPSRHGWRRRSIRPGGAVSTIPELVSLVDRLVAQNLDLQSAAERIAAGARATAGRRVAGSAADQRALHLHARAAEPRTASSRWCSRRLERRLQYRPLPERTEQLLGARPVRPGAPRGRGGRTRQPQAAVEEPPRHRALGAGRAGAGLFAAARLQLQLGVRRTQSGAGASTNTPAWSHTRFANGVATTLDLAQAKAQDATIARPPCRRCTRRQAEMINAIGLLLAEPPRALDAELQQARGPAGGAAGGPGRPAGNAGAPPPRRARGRGQAARRHRADRRRGRGFLSRRVADRVPSTLDGRSHQPTRSACRAAHVPARSARSTSRSSRAGGCGARCSCGKSQQREAALDFQQTVLQAWHDVDNALTAYAEAQTRAIADRRGGAPERAALGAARQRYEEGGADFLNVISSQAQLLQSQTTWPPTTRDRYRPGRVSIARWVVAGRQRTRPAAAARQPLSGQAPPHFMVRPPSITQVWPVT